MRLTALCLKRLNVDMVSVCILIRVCEIDHDVLHHSFANSLWLVAITFLSVGYGDIVPHTYCGRAISVSVGMLGAGCTALVVAVLGK